MSSNKLNELREAAADALRAQERLVSVWRRVEEGKLAPDCSSNDISLLRELIIQRIYPVNAFGLLVQIDRDAAIKVLLSRYLGIGVDPDTKFGGFEFELATMLDVLSEVGGIDCLGKLVRHSEFSVERLAEPRVRRVFSSVLGLEEEQIVPWVKSQRDVQGNK